MTDEPLIKKKLGRWFGRTNDAKVESTALEASGRLPTEMTQLLNDDHHSVPVLLRKLRGIIKREHLKVDTQILEDYAKKVNAGRNVMEAITALRRTVHEAGRLDLQLDRKEELDEAQHQTKILAQEAERARLHGTINEHETAELRQKDERARIRKRTAARKNRPFDADFEERALRHVQENEDFMVAHARLQAEVMSRTDITDSAKQATIEWLKDLCAKELRRRLDNDAS